MNADEFCLEMKGDELDKYRAEYNQIIRRTLEQKKDMKCEEFSRFIHELEQHIKYSGISKVCNHSDNSTHNGAVVVMGKDIPLGHPSIVMTRDGLFDKTKWQDSKNRNGNFIIGSIGAGTSSYLADNIAFVKEGLPTDSIVPNNDLVILLDMENAFPIFSEKQKAHTIDVSKMKFDPFVMSDSQLSANTPIGNIMKDDSSYKKYVAVEILQELAGFTFSPSLKALIDTVLFDYQHKVKNQSVKDSFMSELYYTLNNTVSEEAKKLAFVLEVYVDGSVNLPYLGKSNVNTHSISTNNANMITFNFGFCPHMYRKVACLSVLECIWEKILKVRNGKVWIFISDASYLTVNDSFCTRYSALYRYNKYGKWDITSVLHNISAYNNLETIHLLQMSGQIIIVKPTNSDAEFLVNYLSLPKSVSEFLVTQMPDNNDGFLYRPNFLEMFDYHISPEGIFTDYDCTE